MTTTSLVQGQSGGCRRAQGAEEDHLHAYGNGDDMKRHRGVRHRCDDVSCEQRTEHPKVPQQVSHALESRLRFFEPTYGERVEVLPCTLGERETPLCVRW